MHFRRDREPLLEPSAGEIRRLTDAGLRTATGLAPELIPSLPPALGFARGGIRPNHLPALGPTIPPAHPRRRWTCSAALVLGLSLLSAASGLCDERGSAARIDRALTAYYRHSKDAKTVTELGANYAVKFSDTALRKDKEMARQYLGEAQKLDPNDPAPVAWLGLVLCVEGREDLSKSVAKTGLAKMDWALGRDPGNLDLRILRATCAVEAPAEFNRLDQSISDLEFVLARAKADPGQIKRYDLVMAEVYVNLGMAYRSKGDLVKARTMWDLAAKSDPGTVYAKKASKLLKKYPAPRD